MVVLLITNIASLLIAGHPYSLDLSSMHRADVWQSVSNSNLQPFSTKSHYPCSDSSVCDPHVVFSLSYWSKSPAFLNKYLEPRAPANPILTKSYLDRREMLSVVGTVDWWRWCVQRRLDTAERVDRWGYNPVTQRLDFHFLFTAAAFARCSREGHEHN